MRLWMPGVVVLSVILIGGCCAPCHRLGMHHYAAPGAVYGEEPGVVAYHAGPLAWLWRLLGVGRGYPCDDCGPRYWGDWGGDRAGCEPCDDYGSWTGMPVVDHRAAPAAYSISGDKRGGCPECQSPSSSGSTVSQINPRTGRTSVAVQSMKESSTR